MMTRLESLKYYHPEPESLPDKMIHAHNWHSSPEPAQGHQGPLRTCQPIHRCPRTHSGASTQGLRTLRTRTGQPIRSPGLKKAESGTAAALRGAHTGRFPKSKPFWLGAALGLRRGRNVGRERTKETHEFGASEHQHRRLLRSRDGRRALVRRQKSELAEKVTLAQTG